MAAQETRQTTGQQPANPGDLFDVVGAFGVIMFEAIPGFLAGGDRTRFGNRRYNAAREFFGEAPKPVRPKVRRRKIPTAA